MPTSPSVPLSLHLLRQRKKTMRPLSQYHARRLLELVCDNNKSASKAKDHVDQDVWARTLPPVRGLNFRDRETATCCLRAGGLGAVPSNPQQLTDPQTRALPPAPASNHQQPPPPVESHQSKPTISPAPSLATTQQTLTEHSAHLNPLPARPVPVTEYQELDGDNIVTEVQDELDDEFDDSSPSRLFSDIGPSVSVAKGIDGKKLKHSSEQPLEYFDPVHNNPFPEHRSYHRDDTESEDISMASPPQSIGSQPKTVSSLPSTTTSLPLPSLSSYTLERNNLSANKVTHTQLQPNSMPIPPPPPPLYTVQSYGSAPAVPPPPSSPPPRIDEKRARRDTEDSSPVTESESGGHKGYIHDEFSDLADSSVPSIRADWMHGYVQTPATVIEDEDDLDVGLGARPVESDEEEEYVHGVHTMVDRNMVGMRSEPLLG